MCQGVVEVYGEEHPGGVLLFDHSVHHFFVCVCVIVC